MLQSDTRRRCLRSSWSSESTPGSRAGSTLLHARLATAGYTCPAAPLAPRSPEAGSAGRGQPGPWGGRGAACALPRAAGEPHSPPRRLHAPLGCQNATASLNQRGWTFSPAASTCAGGGGGRSQSLRSGHLSCLGALPLGHLRSSGELPLCSLGPVPCGRRTQGSPRASGKDVSSQCGREGKFGSIIPTAFFGSSAEQPGDASDTQASFCTTPGSFAPPLPPACTSDSCGSRRGDVP